MSCIVSLIKIQDKHKCHICIMSFHVFITETLFFCNIFFLFCGFSQDIWFKYVCYIWMETWLWIVWAKNHRKNISYFAYSSHLTPYRPSVGGPSPGWWMSDSPPWRPRWSCEACLWEAASDWLSGCPFVSVLLGRQPEETPEPLSRSKEKKGPSGCSSHKELRERKSDAEEKVFIL